MSIARPQRLGVAVVSGVLLITASGCGAALQESTSDDTVSTNPSTAATVEVTEGATVDSSEVRPKIGASDAPTDVVASSTTTTTTSTTSTTVPSVVERSGADVGPSTDIGDPLAIRIPSIGVDSAIMSTGVLDDGTVAVPPDANIAGWFNRGPRPGERGPAVIMGHVDSARTGPGVFYRLRDIEVGDVATVDTDTGPQDFVVERIEQHPKLEFPTDDVYGPVPSPALRLITCGGSFDRSVRSYYDNIIVYLVPVQP